MSLSTSYLLGAGFSAPLGYPVGSDLNEHLLGCTPDTFAFHTSGKLVLNADGSKPKTAYKTNFDISYEFCLALMAYFNKKQGRFDYEEFYDFMTYEARKDKEVEQVVAVPFISRFNDVNQLLYSLKNIYSQLVSFYIKDAQGRRWHDNEGYFLKPIFPGYTGFLNTFEHLNSKADIVNIHTLNHDLFFERLANTEWIQEISDGFEELGSPYFGPLSSEKRIYQCRLARYTGRYKAKYRLYKLHGSIDYGVFYKSNGAMSTPEAYLKSRYGIGFGDLNKEIKDETGELIYENCWFNYHADFLTGTTSKIERYQEPLLYKELFRLFRENLANAKSLTIIGYGCKDDEVNKMILQSFDFETKPVFIVDPYPGEVVKKFGAQLSAKLIEKQLDDLAIKDFKI